MAVQYLLPCPCGESIEVTSRQAGDKIRCESCQAELVVPTLRQLRELPIAQEEETRTSDWGARQSIQTGSVVLALLLGAGAAWFALTEPDPPPKFDSAARAVVIDSALEKLTAVQVWDLWQTQMAPLKERGFAPFEPPMHKYIKEQIAESQLARNTLAASAVAVLVLGGLASTMVRTGAQAAPTASGWRSF